MALAALQRGDGAALLDVADGLRQTGRAAGGPEDLQRLINLAAASVFSKVGAQGRPALATQTAGILGRLHAAAAGGAAPAGLAADTITAGQQAAAAAAAEQAAWLGAARKLDSTAATALVKPQPSLCPAAVPAPGPPADYLAGVRGTLAQMGAARCQQNAAPTSQQAAEGCDTPAAAAEASSAAPASPPGAAFSRVLEDDREVAVSLTFDPAHPSSPARLSLQLLGPARTQAAIAAKLAGGRAARQQEALRQQLHGRQRMAELHRGLLSAERAALLSTRVAQVPFPSAALASVLRAGPPALGRRQGGTAGVAAQQEQHASGGEEVQMRRQRLGQAVMAQHKEMRKAWREKKQHEQRERLEALRGNNVEEYMRLMAAASGGRRNPRLDSLLSQTDTCLRQLTARLQASGVAADLLVPAGGSSPGSSPSASASADGSGGSSSGGGSGSGRGASRGEGVAALEQSHEAWNRLARAFQAEVAEQPKLLTGGELREYQMTGLRWMVGLHARGLNGILADEMGLGKTIQVIGLACHLAGELGERRPFLIAVPSSVLPNWEAELARWAPGLKVICYRGDPAAREDVWRRQMRGGRGGNAGPGTHVVLTTYDFLMGKADKPRLPRVHWSYIVVDEGHRLKNAGCKLNAELRGYTADNRLLLTGTPLQNNISELWSLLNFLMPSLFDSGDDFEEWFGGAGGKPGAACGAAAGAAEDSDEEEGAARAAEAAMLTEEEALIVTNRLHQVLRPFILRRLKETVASELPQKREHLLPVLPSPYQQALFRLMQSEMERGGGKGLKGVNNVVMEMRNVCNTPLISRLHAEGSETGLPPHVLPAEVRLCSKLELLDRLLVKLRAGGHKVLLFCTMTRALDVIADYLDWRGFPHLRMDGSTAAGERGELVSRFNDPAGGEFVFLLSIRAGGVGLNLQGADTVIMYDTDWNPQMDAQAQARAHRMGQTKEVLVLRLKTIGTIEERVVGVASSKARLADRSITGGFFDDKTSPEERQRYLLDTIRSSASGSAGGTGGPTAGPGAAAVPDAAGAGSSSDASGSVAAGETQPGSQLSDAQLNRLLARGEGELALFEAEDRRMQAAELASWKALHAPTATAAGKGKGKQQAGAGDGLPAYCRLAGEGEVAPLVAAAAELLQPKKDVDEGRELGRGKRQRGTAPYRDLPEREFSRLCREGVAAGQAPVPLLAGAGVAAAPQAGGQQPGDGRGGKRRKVAAGAAPQPEAAPAATGPAKEEAVAEAVAAAQEATPDVKQEQPDGEAAQEQQHQESLQPRGRRSKPTRGGPSAAAPAPARVTRRAAELQAAQEAAAQEAEAAAAAEAPQAKRRRTERGAGKENAGGGGA